MTNHKATVRKPPGTGLWHITCPCTYQWHTQHHRLALLFATHHTHQEAQR